MVKNLPTMREIVDCRLRLRFHPRVGKTLWRREWQSMPIFLPREFHGQRSLVGYSPWDCKESDMTERLTHRIPVIVIVELCLDGIYAL